MERYVENFHTCFMNTQSVEIKKRNPTSFDIGFLFYIRLNYLTVATKYFVTLQNNSGFEISTTT